MPADAKDFDSDVLLNCGLCKDRGTVRTSTTRVTPWARSSPTNSSRGWVEWPIVSTTGGSIESGFGLRATVEAFISDAFIDERHGCLLLVADPAPSQFDLPPDLEDLAAALLDQPSRFIELLDRDSSNLSTSPAMGPEHTQDIPFRL